MLQTDVTVASFFLSTLGKKDRCPNSNGILTSAKDLRKTLTISSYQAGHHQASLIRVCVLVRQLYENLSSSLLSAAHAHCLRDVSVC